MRKEKTGTERKRKTKVTTTQHNILKTSKFKTHLKVCQRCENMLA